MGKSLRDRTKDELLSIIKDMREEIKGKDAEIKKLNAVAVNYDLTHTGLSVIRDGDDFRLVVLEFDPESGAAKVSEKRNIKPHGKSIALASRAGLEFLTEEIIRKI
jgi:hypothetical protein